MPDDPTSVEAPEPADEGAVPRVLPRGPHGLGREVVAASQRTRLLDSMAETVAGHGYAATTVADVISRAGVSRKTFYEHFSGKEECFLEAYADGVEAVSRSIARRVEGVARSDEAPADPRTAIEAGAAAFLEALAERPAFARTFVVEVMGAGDLALERREAVLERFVELITALRSEVVGEAAAPETSRHLIRATVGAVHELIFHEIRTRGPEGLPALAPIVAEVALALLERSR